MAFGSLNGNCSNSGNSNTWWVIVIAIIVLYFLFFDGNANSNCCDPCDPCRNQSCGR